MITARERLALLGATVASLASGHVSAAEPGGGAKLDAETAELEAAWDGFQQALGKAAEFVRTHEYYKSPENRATAYSMIIATMIEDLEKCVIFDADFPFFTIHDARVHAAGDNPDQRYSISRIRGGETYRIWGRLAGERRLDVQIYAGNPYVPKGGRSAAFLPFENLKLGVDRSFEIFLSPQERGQNWLQNPPDGTQVMLRQIFADWRDELPGEVHIDRVGMEGAAKPKLSSGEMGRRLRSLSEQMTYDVKAWPALLAMNFGYPKTPIPVNVLPKPFDTSPFGGVKGRIQVAAPFLLQEDEALLIRSWPQGTNYQGIQLRDMWGSALEYANRQTSLASGQAYLSKDGTYWFVISMKDPGVQNWLDTSGFHQGIVSFRYDGLNGRTIDPDKAPNAKLVKFQDVLRVLPADMPRVSEAQRQEAIAMRRRHIQNRCHI